jgi:type VI secretion system protein ImpG
MREEGLRDYYEQELRYLRELGKEFAEEHGEIAEGLRMEAGQWADPHVERLLEGFAFLAARIHRRMDNDFGEVSQGLLNAVAPHFLRPIPSMSIVQMATDPSQGLPSGLVVPSGQSLISPPAKETGVRCRFQTCYSTEIWPVEVQEAKWQSPHGLDLGRRAKEVAACFGLNLGATAGLNFSDLEMDRLRIHLAGDLNLMTTLYELLDNNCQEILIRDLDDPGKSQVVLPGSSLIPVGMEADEGILPLPRKAFLAYRIIQEYFVFPQKFLFFDLTGLDAVTRSDFGPNLEILFLFGPFPAPERQEALERGVTKDTIRLGCTPVVNLFQSESEPIRLTQRRSEYLIRAKGASSEFSPEIYSVDSMAAVVSGSTERVPLEPLHSFRSRGAKGKSPVFWHTRRFLSSWLEDGATDIGVAFVDPANETIFPDFPSVSAKVTCFNGTLPGRLPIGSDQDFQAEGGEGAGLKKVTSVMHPTEPIQPPLKSSTFWRIVSQLSLNYLSLVDEGGDALREVLRLYNFGGTEVGEKNVQGISGVQSEPWYARVRGEHGLSFARGRKIIIEFDESLYSGGGIYLLASVLDRFLGLYASMNSFSKLEARVRSKQRTYTLREWDPRAGQKPLL